MTNNEYIVQLISNIYKGDLKVEGSTSNITVKVDDRSTVKSKLYAFLDEHKYAYTDEKSTKSSFNITKIKTPINSTVSLVWKNITGGGGSGAGAEVTDLGESAQCWYCAAAFRHSLESLDDMLEVKDKVKSYCDTTAVFEEIYKKLPDDWVESVIMTANKMKTLPEFKSNLKTFEFHRGSDVVDKISQMFLSANRKDILFANINKWTPADIWLMTPKGKTAIKSAKTEQTFASLNQMITELYVSRDLIGVSLKKVGATVKAEIFNFGGNKYTPEFKSFSITEKSKDGYIVFSYKEDPAMKIQFRSFSDTGSWQGEIKGKYAAGGKIGGGQVAAIFKRITNVSLSSLDAKVITKRVQSKDKTIDTEIGSMAKAIGLSLSVPTVTMQSDDWKYSKYLTLEFMSEFKKLDKTKQQRVLGEIIGYSSSATENSAVFIKMS
jgi:hypothetical protein